MVYKREQMEIMRFFSLMYGNCKPGNYVELRPTNFAGSPDFEKRRFIPAWKQEEFAEAALELKDYYHVYYGVCTRTKEVKVKRKGTTEYLSELPALWADLDGDDYSGGVAEASQILSNFRLPPSVIINSGHGFHAYFLLDKPYDLNQGHRKPTAMLKSLQVEELHSDPTYSLAWVLRIMNTTNIKNPSKLVVAKTVKMENIRYSFEELANELDWEKVLEEDHDNIEGVGLKEGKYDGLEKVLNSDFIEYCRTHAVELSEPLWYAMITNLIPFKGGREAIHDLSRPYPDYSKEETNKKINHALRDAPGPHTAAYIREHGFDSKDCKEAGVKSPAGLAFVKGTTKKQTQQKVDQL